MKNPIRWLVVFCLLVSPLITAVDARSVQAAEVTAFDLIAAMNTLRVSNGLPALIEDPIINAVAQSTAQTMAANLMSWHIGDVRGRLAAAGYGGGDTVWATENFAVGDLSIDQIMVVWSDASHMRPAVNPAYCHVGAGVATAADGRTYYVLQAAYTSTHSCGEYLYTEADTERNAASQPIIPVKIATPDEEDRVFHVVEAGQTLWAIAVAYKVTIQDLETWNNLSKNSILRIGQSLFIPDSNTEGYSTPTPVGMVQVSAPDANGKIVHTVKEYQTLITIAQAYETNISSLLALNGIQVNWPLQIGQELIIDHGSVPPTPTPRPLTPIEKLTPASDGRYYHTVNPNETLSWIASLYDVRLSDLMAWNGLSDSSILRPEQQLLLNVTPPATETSQPADSSTGSSVVEASSATSTPLPSVTPTEPDQDSVADSPPGRMSAVVLWTVSIVLVIGGSLLAAFVFRKKS
jgi:LysM repeat protein